MSRTAKKTAKWGFFALGAGLLVLLLGQLGWGTIVAKLQLVGLRFGWLLLIMALWEGLNAFAWKVLIGPEGKNISFSRLYFAREAGEAFNILTPLATVAGEPVKAYLLKESLPLTALAASLIVDKMVKFIASLMLILSGTLLGLALLELPGQLSAGLLIFALLSSAALFVFYLLQKRGLLSRFQHLLERIGFKSSANLAAGLEKIDISLAAFYREDKARFALAIGIQFLSRLVAIVEIYLVALFLGVPISWLTALFIGSLVAAANGVFAFIPAQLGTFEGAQTLIFHLLRLGAEDGLALGLVRRLRILFWAGLWLVLFYGREIKTWSSGRKTKENRKKRATSLAQLDQLPLPELKVDKSDRRLPR